MGPELTPDTLGESENRVPAIRHGVVLSFESQLKLRSLYHYVDTCRLALVEIQRALALGGTDAAGLLNLQGATEGLERFCVDADSWGFNALYEIAMRLQMLLLNSGSNVHKHDFRETFQRGLSMLSALLDQCERDFCWRLAIADMLESINQAGRN